MKHTPQSKTRRTLCGRFGLTHATRSLVADLVYVTSLLQPPRLGQVTRGVGVVSVLPRQPGHLVVLIDLALASIERVVVPPDSHRALLTVHAWELNSLGLVDHRLDFIPQFGGHLLLLLESEYLLVLLESLEELVQLLKRLDRVAASR
jgi:hypothetical protein